MPATYRFFHLRGKRIPDILPATSFAVREQNGIVRAILPDGFSESQCRYALSQMGIEITGEITPFEYADDLYNGVI